MRRPPPLQQGDKVAIIAPATCVDSDQLHRGIATLTKLGFKVLHSPNLEERRDRYLAGSDSARAEEIHHYFLDNSTKALFCIRGGFGSSRVIPLLNSRIIKRNPKLFVGYSDITSLHLYFNHSCGMTTIYGAHPAEIDDFGEMEKTILLQMLTSKDPLGEFTFDHVEQLFPGRARGKLIGGCLSLLASSIGTQYEVDTRGNILFIEEYDEPPYRLDRMLTHLKNAGKLNKLKGVIFGSMIECDDNKHGYYWQDVVTSVFQDNGIPIMTEFPSGHGEGKICLPLGTEIEMDTTKRSITFLEAATKE
ncbi:MAG: hypothetical protein A3F16_04175 [Deltaproteobacteria bacterium RIFCSPHIGHO2_12_FULL_43_9]|nr:MAG: hypothetical protein A3F16_04175 [Deltaproteobacteria bacterium RIFCSPHIGHO2_12_FULL_43_9]